MPFGRLSTDGKELSRSSHGDEDAGRQPFPVRSNSQSRITVHEDDAEDENCPRISRGFRPRPMKLELLTDVEPALADDDIPQTVQYRRDVNKVGLSYTHMFRSLSYITEPVYFALKVALLVTLPLCVLVFHPEIGHYFQAGPMLAVVGTSSAQLYVGQQLSGTVIIIQSAAWVMMWGTFMNAIGVPRNNSAWWGFAFTGVILVSFLTNMRSRRSLMSYTVIIMQMERTQSGDAMTKPFSVGWCFLLAIAVASLQCFVPYPLLISRKTDGVFAKAWLDVGRITRQLREGVWSGRTMSGYVETSRAECDELGAVVDSIPGLLFYISYEPFERSMFNQLRNIRLTMLRRLLVILYATCTASRSVTAVYSAKNLDQQKAWKSRLREPLNAFLDALDTVLFELGQTLGPQETVSRCSFDALQEKKDGLLTALQSCRSHVAIRNASETDATAFYYFLYFHLLLAFLAEELHSFAEQMQECNPKQFKSTWRRFLEFFFLDYWNDFRMNLLDRVLLRTEDDVNSLKEGIRLACAYCVAAAFTTKLNEELYVDSYFFGMSIILGMGLPTASESIDIGVQRIAGLSFALSVGYLAEWKTPNLVTAIAMVVFGTFIATCFRENHRYQHVAYYASFVGPAAFGIAKDLSTVAARVVDNSFAVVAYFAICGAMFPVNPVRVLWNKQVVCHKSISELITMLTSVAQLPVDMEHNDIALARLDVAASILKKIESDLVDCAHWMQICSKEPIIVGSPFPAARVEAMHTLTKHTVAGLEVGLFGLQILFRERLDPPHHIVSHMLRVMSPIMRDLEVASRVVFQDLIDAVEMPREWTVERSWKHFEDFVLVKARLEQAFQALHLDMNRTQNQDLRRQLALAVMDFGDGWMNNFSLAGSFLGNRSFVGKTSFAFDPANIRRVSNVGMTYDVRNPQSHAPCEGSSRLAMNYQSPRAINRSFISKPSVASQGDQSPSREGQRNAAAMVHMPPSPSIPGASSPMSQPPQSQHALQLSFRAPVGNLPIDVDVTAFTIIIVSTSQLISSLEQMVPHVNSVNLFARSQLETKPWGVKKFFMCS